MQKKLNGFINILNTISSPVVFLTKMTRISDNSVRYFATKKT